MTMTMVATAGVVSAVLLGAAAAEAQIYGGYLPPPAYAEANTDYTRGGEACGGFTLAGARAGVTVLGVDIDAGAGLRIGTSVGCRGHREPRYAPPAASYAPPPVYASPPAYAPTAPASPYENSYAEPAPSYGYGEPCGCGSPPTYYRQPSRYGW